ncbi:hypothetical protein PG996_014316 [Apiospora saccharicola]|uniref:Uncharacterized protein n=1 Tax=Apiospora saccharicola TaxID=335842 RepID=A0ABR1TIP9_9PEZI
MTAKEPGVFPILELPAEVRLEVYKWVYLQHPIRNKILGPHGPCAYVCKRVVVGGGGMVSEVEPGSSMPNAGSLADDETPLLSPHRPWAAVPTALLLVSRQIYAEARALALERNEFDFASLSRTLTHAGPGLWAARDCTLRLLPQPWQCDALRYARLEVTVWDFVTPGGGAGAAWAGLCRLWSRGLRSLRLKVRGGGGGGGGGSSRKSWVVVRQEGGGGGGGGAVCKGQEEKVPLRVVLAGLRLLKALRQLEVELALPSWDAEKKLSWCRRMGDALNENKGKGSSPVEVICVEPL